MEMIRSKNHLQFRNQPPPFYLIFILELWERFGFYTVQGLLTLYFINTLHLSTLDAYYTFGAFSALVYGFIALGGLIGDRILGPKRTLLIGLYTLTFGYLLLALLNKHYPYIALAWICVGNGLFKTNPSFLLSECYKNDSSGLHSGFTLYYMAVNIGALIALLLAPLLARFFGYSIAYFTSFLGLLGATLYYRQRQSIIPSDHPCDQQRITFKTSLSLFFGILLLIYFSFEILIHPAIGKKILITAITIYLCIYFYKLRQEDRPAQKKMLIALALMIEAIIFFTLYQQMPTSLILFTVEHVKTVYWGYSIDPQTFRALNAFWIITLTPAVIHFYAWLDLKNIRLTVPYKFAIGMALSAFSFLILSIASMIQDPNDKVSALWVILSYAFNSLGELFISALGAAMITELVPQKMRGFVMGMWFLTSSIAGFSGAYVASWTGVSKFGHEMASIHVYGTVFGWIGCITLAISLLLWLIAPTLSDKRNSELAL